jgi:hypothetical protein
LCRNDGRRCDGIAVEEEQPERRNQGSPLILHLFVNYPAHDAVSGCDAAYGSSSFDELELKLGRCFDVSNVQREFGQLTVQ